MASSTPQNGVDAKSPPQTQAPPCQSPQRIINNYASTNTPIMSAKRPKKRSAIPTSNLSPNQHHHTSLRTPEAGNQSTRQCTKVDPTPLSPMHKSARPVPRDSHNSTHVAVDAAAMESEPGVSAKLSIETDAFTNNIADVPEDGESPASASWVGRKVDAIFSPVLSFLHGATSSASSTCDDDIEGNTGKGQAQSDPENKTMEDNHDKAVSSMGEIQNCCELSDTAESIKHSPYNYDSIPSVINTNSSGSQLVDADGDVAMAELPKIDHQSEVAKSENNCALPAPMNSCDDYEENRNLTSHSNNQSDSTEVYQDDDGEDEDEDEEFNPYLFIKCLPPYQHAIPLGWTSRPKALPPLDCAVSAPIPPICLVLDLDETLVHCTVEPVPDADMVFPVEFNGMEYQVHVRCRPFLQEFLEAVSAHFEVVIFTASQQVYADTLLDMIDPEGKFINHRMFRDSCLPVGGNFLKDLTILGRDLSKAVLVDNSPHAFGYQVDNGIPIESWFDNPNDKELLKLEVFLRSLHGVEDVRDVVRRTFQTHQLVLDA